MDHLTYQSFFSCHFSNFYKFVHVNKQTDKYLGNSPGLSLFDKIAIERRSFRSFLYYLLE
jgi:hypothetical protein